jgi:hypothetical protein
MRTGVAPRGFGEGFPGEGGADLDAGEASAIGARARMIRRRRGLSLEVVTGLAGISKQYLSALGLGHSPDRPVRRGKPSAGQPIPRRHPDVI